MQQQRVGKEKRLLLLCHLYPFPQLPAEKEEGARKKTQTQTQIQTQKRQRRQTEKTDREDE